MEKLKSKISHTVLNHQNKKPFIELLLAFLLDQAGTDKFHAKAPSQVFDKPVFAKVCQLFGEEQACSRITLLVVHRHRIEWPYAQEDGC